MKSKADNFISIPYTIENLDRYIVRNSIFKALRDSVPVFTGRLLDIGCGNMPYKKFILEKSSIREYVGLDIENALLYSEEVKPDFRWDGQQMPFSDQEFDSAFGTEVLEHCPDPLIVLKEVYRVLKPGGVFFFTVPFLWPLHEVPHDEYRFTPFALKRLLTNSGFREIDLKPLGGWDASLGQMIGLWSRRRPLKGSIRKLVSRVAFLLVKYLYKKDIPPATFREGTMITGIWGIAIK